MLLGILVFVGGIFVMILVHEAAHFVTAKRYGMKVDEFFLGFGPRVWSFRRGETEYGVKALPLGGYVRIAGMNPFEEIPPRTETGCSPPSPSGSGPWSSPREGSRISSSRSCCCTSSSWRSASRRGCRRSSQRSSRS